MKKVITAADHSRKTYNKEQLIAAVNALLQEVCDRGGYSGYEIEQLLVHKHARPVRYRVLVTFSIEGAVLGSQDYLEWDADVPVNQDIPVDYYSRDEKYVNEILQLAMSEDEYYDLEDLYDELFDRFTEAANTYAQQYGCELYDEDRFPSHLHVADIRKLPGAGVAQLTFRVGSVVCPAPYSCEARNDDLQVTGHGFTVRSEHNANLYKYKVDPDELDAVDDIDFSDMQDFFGGVIELVSGLIDRLEEVVSAEADYDRVCDLIESKFSNITCRSMQESNKFHGIRSWEGMPGVWLAMDINMPTGDAEEFEIRIPDIFNPNTSKILKSVQGKIRRLNTKGLRTTSVGDETERLI